MHDFAGVADARRAPRRGHGPARTTGAPCAVPGHSYRPRPEQHVAHATRKVLDTHLPVQLHECRERSVGRLQRAGGLPRLRHACDGHVDQSLETTRVEVRTQANGHAGCGRGRRLPTIHGQSDGASRRMRCLRSHRRPRHRLLRCCPPLPLCPRRPRQVHLVALWPPSLRELWQPHPLRRSRCQQAWVAYINSTFLAWACIYLGRVLLQIPDLIAQRPGEGPRGSSSSFAPSVIARAAPAKTPSSERAPVVGAATHSKCCEVLACTRV